MAATYVLPVAPSMPAVLYARPHLPALLALVITSSLLVLALDALLTVLLAHQLQSVPPAILATFCSIMFVLIVRS